MMSKLSRARVQARFPSLRTFVPVLTCCVIAAACVLLSADSAWARPGGGSGYSGGRSSGGGSRSSGGGGGDIGFVFEIVWFLLRLCFEHPTIGIPLVLITIAIAFVVLRARAGEANAWESGSGSKIASGATRDEESYRGDGGPDGGLKRSVLGNLRTSDPNFSVAVFEDFLYALYTEAQLRRGAKTLRVLSAYLSQPVLVGLEGRTRGVVSDVIVGAMRYLEVAPARNADDFTRVTVEFESNFTEQSGDLRNAYYARERWTLRRKASAKSRDPKTATVFGCPKCGAPQDAVFAGKCKYCNTVVASGEFDWFVSQEQQLVRESRPPILTGFTEERGTSLETVCSGNPEMGFGAIKSRDANVTWGSLSARIGKVFSEFNEAWTAQDLGRMRAVLSDRLFESQKSWIEAYRRQHLRNMNEGARITNLELAAVANDAYYDSVTVRVYATGRDYTLDAGGRVVAGNQKRERLYTEYWTFIRGASRQGPPRTDGACPNCGAPLKVSMAGNCTHCNVKVTSGDFDWVLSRIEQDESYSG
jgi:predicted lipid-binding transport protein (Tim44 family)